VDENNQPETSAGGKFIYLVFIIIVYLSSTRLCLIWE